MKILCTTSSLFKTISTHKNNNYILYNLLKNNYSNNNSFCCYTTITNTPITMSNDNNNNKIDMTSLGDRMKSYENAMKIQVEKNKSFIIRLDGHSFSKFSKAFKPPGSGIAWDIRIHQAMIETATSLMKTFNPNIIYTFSDEITMAFPSIDESTLEDGDELPGLAYSGKVQKLISLTAGLASTVFYKSITNANYDTEKDKNIIKLLQNSTPSFDSRLFVLPSNDEIRNNLVWRSVIDCKRNSVSGLGQANFSNKELYGLSGLEVKKKLIEEKGIDYNNEPDWYKYGVYLKKQYYKLDTYSRLDPSKKITAIRNKVVPFSFDITKLSNSNEFITKKILDDNFKLEFNLNPLSLSNSTNSTNSTHSNI